MVIMEKFVLMRIVAEVVEGGQVGVTDSAAVADAAQAGSGGSALVWMIVAGVELAVIVLLLLGRRGTANKDKKKMLKEKVMAEGEVDFRNIMESPFKAGELYKELIRKCHPDRFVGDDERVKAATELSARLTEKQNDYKALLALKQEAEEKLNIKTN